MILLLQAVIPQAERGVDYYITNVLKLACDAARKAKITVERWSQQISEHVHEIAVSCAYCAS